MPEREFPHSSTYPYAAASMHQVYACLLVAQQRATELTYLVGILTIPAAN